MEFREIKNNVFYCGLNDEHREFFDELIPLDKGTSYNSYLVKGSEKTALIDTMYPPKIEEYIKNLEENGIDNVDYIIANHGEQDHTGAIPALLKKYPNAVVITNPTCKNNIIEMLLVPEDKICAINNGDEISLGDKTLKFIFAPAVHWPDTMFTYLKEDKILCTCDFLGAHFVFDDIWAEPSKELEKSAKKYYAEIMMPFRPMCKKYLNLIDEMDIDMILPSHGPLHKNIDYILNLYKDWTSDECKNLAIFPYVSMYKSNEQMIDYLIDKFSKNGVECFKFDLIRCSVTDLVTKLVDAKIIVLGCSMVLANPHPAAMNFAYLAKLLKPKAQYGAIVGSYGWGGHLTEPLIDMLKPLRMELFVPVTVKGKMKPEDCKKLDALADEILKKETVNA